LAILAKMYKMDKITISSTELKNRTANVLNDVYFRGKTAVVNRYGKPVVKIVPVKEEGIENRGRNFMKLAGVWKNIDADKMIREIYKARRDGSRKRKFLGNW